MSHSNLYGKLQNPKVSNYFKPWIKTNKSVTQHQLTKQIVILEHGLIKYLVIQKFRQKKKNEDSNSNQQGIIDKYNTNLVTWSSFLLRSWISELCKTHCGNKVMEKKNTHKHFTSNFSFTFKTIQFINSSSPFKKVLTS